jgi:hypothetical protein
MLKSPSSYVALEKVILLLLDGHALMLVNLLFMSFTQIILFYSLTEISACALYNPMLLQH